MTDTKQRDTPAPNGAQALPEHRFFEENDQKEGDNYAITPFEGAHARHLERFNLYQTHEGANHVG